MSKAKQQWYYAVGVGRSRGVFATWAETEPLIKGINNAKYRKFSTQNEAEQFVEQHASPMKSGGSPITTPPVTPNRDSMKYYTQHPTVKPSETCSAISKSRQMSTWLSPSNHPAGSSSTQPPSRAAFMTQLASQTSACNEDDEEEEEPILFLSTQPSTSSASNSQTDLKPSSNTTTKITNEELYKTLNALKNRLESIEESLHDVIGKTTIKIKKLKIEIAVIEAIIIKNNNAPELSNTLKRLKEKSEEREETKPIKRAKLIDIEVIDDATQNNNKQENKSNFNFDSEGFCIIYTDGACTNNGQKGAKAGIGVYFGDNHPLNVAEPLTTDCPATNNNAEIRAASHALNVAKKAGIKKVRIITDSQFTINCITMWLKSWKKRGWKKADGKPVQNRDQLEILESACKDIEVEWKHVRGHSNIHGNEMADRLANEGAARYIPL